jgi:carbamoyl-phosphate synthase large subunit
MPAHVQEKPDALLPTMGGQTALNLAVSLAEARLRSRAACPVLHADTRRLQSGVLERHGVELIGAKLKAIQMAEDRQLFKEAMARIGLKTPQSGTACTCVVCLLPAPAYLTARASLFRLEQGLAVAETIGTYPLVIRPAFTLGGSGGGIAYNRQEFEAIVASGIQASTVNQVLIERSLLGWKEFEVRRQR